MPSLPLPPSRRARPRALLALAAALLLTAAPILAATTLTLGHAVTPEHPRAKAAQFFADQVKARSQGRLVVEVLGGASFGDDVAMLKGLQNGSLDISANSQGPVAAVVPELNAFGLPFLFTTPAQAWRLLDGPLGQTLADRMAERGLVLLGFWDNGIRHFTNGTRPLLRPADFAGLKLRVPSDPVTVDIVEALGAEAVTLKFSSLYNGLQRKQVDGQENPLINIEAAKLYEVQKYLSLTGHKYETTPLIMNLRTWDGLAPADREILRSAAQEATRYQRDLTRQANEEALHRLTTQGMRVDRVEKAPFVAATRHIYDQWYARPEGDYIRAVVKAARSAP